MGRENAEKSMVLVGGRRRRRRRRKRRRRKRRRRRRRRRRRSRPDLRVEEGRGEEVRKKTTLGGGV